VRSNGLTAHSYTPVADLDPVLATGLLADLKQQGIAAYTKPVESTTTSGFDGPEFRVNVRDRLYVDSRASARVRGLLSERDPHLLDLNDDLTWAQLVAGFDLPLADGERPWPAQEDFGPADDGAAPAQPSAPPGATDADSVLPFTDLRNRAGGLGSRDERDPSAALSDRTPDDAALPHREPFDDADFLASTSKTTADDEPFVPDPPPPLPRPAPHRQVAWLGLVSGPILLILVALFGIRPPDWVAFLGVLGFIGGFIALVATMSDRDDGEWGPDDGAVV
jgi:hypothetical protein